ncbi:MAG TPA: type II toxin-antitoxin system RelE/ParE family toxin [Caulobacterales bacterium]|nr:type II toxin-antitoxin system RelE/ParE family toxin [Caulobacterales bacterium]
MEDYLEREAGARIAQAQSNRILEKAQTRRDMPTLGRRRDDLGAGRRLAVVTPYVILYRETGGQVRVLRIVYGARDVPTLLRDAPD